MCKWLSVLALSNRHCLSNPRRQQPITGGKARHPRSTRWVTRQSHVHNAQCFRCRNPRLPRGMKTEVLTQVCTWAVNDELPSPDNLRWSKWKRTKPMNDTREEETLCSPPVTKQYSKLAKRSFLWGMDFNKIRFIASPPQKIKIRTSIFSSNLPKILANEYKNTVRTPLNYFFFYLEYIFNSK